MSEEKIKNTARELGQKYFPDEENIFARSNIEAQKVELACMEMAKETFRQVFQWMKENLVLTDRAGYIDGEENKSLFLRYGDWDGWGEAPKIDTENIINEMKKHFKIDK